MNRQPRVRSSALARPARGLAALALVAATIAAGCSSGPTPVPYAREYPKNVRQDGSIDIQVFRDTKTIELTNTSGQTFGPSTIWLNARFCRPIDGFAVGQTLKLPLAEFRDQWQDPFRGGGFFAIDTPDRLVLAQIETPTLNVFKPATKPEAEPETQPAAPAELKSKFLGMVVVTNDVN